MFNAGLKMRLVALSLAIIMVLNFSMIAFASTTVTPATKVLTEESVEKTSTVEASGKLGFLVKLALKVIRAAIKYGGKELSWVLGRLDASSAKYLLNNTNKIVKGIDNALAKISSATDYATATIRQILIDGFRIAKITDKYGVPIADAIAAVVNILIF